MLRTERGYENPCIRQLSVFLRNRVGELGDLLRHLEKENLAVHAVSIADSIDFAVVRLIVNDTNAAAKALTEAGFAISEGNVLAVELPDDRTGLLQICRALIGGEINIYYAYTMIARPGGKGAMLVRVDDVETARDALSNRGFQILEEEDLRSL